MTDHVDNIVALGKWAYDKIPPEQYCRDCLLLGEKWELHEKSYYCDLRSTVGLVYDKTHVFKGSYCPKPGGIK